MICLKRIILVVFLSYFAWGASPLLAQASRNVLLAIPGETAAFVTAPLHWGLESWGMATGAALALGITVHHDEAFQLKIQAGRSDRGDRWWGGVTHLGNGGAQAAVAVGGMLVGNKEFSKISAVALQSLALSGIFVVGTKLATASIRPDVDQRGRRFFDYATGGLAAKTFPSGHTTSSFAMAEVYGSRYGRWWTYSVASLVAYSRVYLHRHWTGDVLAGALLGIVAGHSALVQARLYGPALRWWRVGEYQGKPLLQANFHF